MTAKALKRKPPEPVVRPSLKEFPLSKVYQLLEPGPAVLLTTSHKGRPNVMTMSWHMMVEFEPPLVACVVNKRPSIIADTGPLPSTVQSRRNGGSN